MQLRVTSGPFRSWVFRVRDSSRRFPQHLAALLAVVALAACGGSAPTAKAPAAEKPVAGEPSLPSLDPGKIVFAMRGHETDIRKCFFRNPHDRGSVRIQWHADSSGVVQNPTVVHSTVTTKAIEDCLLDQVGALRFGPLDQAARGQWVFVFRLATPPPSGGKNARNRRASPPEEGLRLDDSSKGWLEPERIESVVEAGYRLFARCYRAGLERKEDLAGSLRFRFTIGDEGQIDVLSDLGSDLSDLFAVDCIAESFYAFKFPKPERGPVTVSYHLRLN